MGEAAESLTEVYPDNVSGMALAGTRDWWSRKPGNFGASRARNEVSDSLEHLRFSRNSWDLDSTNEAAKLRFMVEA